MAGKKPAMAKAAAKRAGGQGQPTNWLAPLSAQQVTQQAANTVRSAYNPLYGSLDQQTKQLLAVRQKQDADNQYYQQWLDSKSAALSAAQSAVDQTTNDLETKLTGNQATVFAAEPDQLVSAANARAGNVSNNAQSNTFGSELAATQAPLRESLSGTATQSLDMEKNAEAQNVASSANADAYLQAGRQKEASSFDTAMTGLSNERANLQSKETGDLIKEVARLQGVQQNVAQSNRSYQTAAAQLGLQTANITSEIAARTAGTKIAQQNADTAQSKAAFSQWLDTQNLNLNEKKYVLSVLNTNSEIASRNAKLRQGPLTQGEENTIYGGIDKIRGEISTLVGQGLSAQQAWHAAAQGFYIRNNVQYKTAAGKTATHNVKVTVTKIENQGVLNAAYNLATQGALSPGDAQYLQTLGLAPSQRYKVHSKIESAASKGTGAASSVVDALTGAV